MIKWIISDMDGTLLVSENQLPADFPEVMQMLKERNIMFSPASGRQLSSLQHHFKDYINDLIFISDNGTYVWQNGKELFSATIPAPTVKLILDILKDVPDIFLIVSCKDIAYTNTKNQRVIDELSLYYTANEYVEDFHQIDLSNVIKLAIFTEKSSQHVYDLLQEKLQGKNDIQVVISNQYWVDINPANVNKGAAIKKLQEKLGINPSECVAFGDYLNDYEMLQAVGESYAMENALPKLKAIAKHIAPANTESGVTKTIRKILAEQDKLEQK